jgi:hypothetical protein
VHYSRIDNDDTLASYADRDNAGILSRDRDFFRYSYKNDIQVYFDYHLKDGKIFLKKAKHY